MWKDKAEDGYPIVTSLCWDCAKCGGDCSWSRDFEPVPGWDAEERMLYFFRSNLCDYEREERSFYVKKCPEFERDSYFDLGEKNSKWLRKRGEPDGSAEKR